MGVCNSKKGKHDVVSGHKKMSKGKKNGIKGSNAEDTMQSTQPQCDVPPNLDNTPQNSDVLRAEEAKKEDLERLKRHGGFISYNQFDHDEMHMQSNEQSATIHKTERYTIELATVPTSPPATQQEQHMSSQSKNKLTNQIHLAGPPLAGLESNADVTKQQQQVKEEPKMLLQDKHNVEEEHEQQQQVASLLSTTVAAGAKPTSLSNAAHVSQEVHKNNVLAEGNNKKKSYDSNNINCKEEQKENNDDDNNAETDDSDTDNNVFSDPSADESDISDKEDNHRRIERYYNKPQNDNAKELKHGRIIVTDNKAGASDEESENGKEIAQSDKKNEAEIGNNDKIVDVRRIEVSDQSTSKSNAADQVKTANAEISNTLNTLTASSVTGVMANAASSNLADSSAISASPGLSLHKVENANATAGTVVQVPATSHVEVCASKENAEDLESDKKECAKNVLQEEEKTSAGEANVEHSTHVLLDRGSSNARVEEVIILPTSKPQEQTQYDMEEINQENEDTPVIRRAPPPPPSPPRPSSEPLAEQIDANEAHEEHPAVALNVVDKYEKHDHHHNSVNETEQVIVHADHTTTRTKIETRERSIPMHELYDIDKDNKQNAHVSELHATSIMTDAHNRPIGTFEQTEFVFTSSSNYPDKPNSIKNIDNNKINVEETPSAPLTLMKDEGKKEEAKTSRANTGANKNAIVEEPETMTSVTNDNATKSTSSSSSSSSSSSASSSEENHDRYNDDENGKADVENIEDVEIVKKDNAQSNVTQHVTNNNDDVNGSKKESSVNNVKCIDSNVETLSSQNNGAKRTREDHSNDDNLLDVNNKAKNLNKNELNKLTNKACYKESNSDEEQDEEEDQGTAEQKGNPREITQVSTASEMYPHHTMTTNTTCSQPVHNASLSISSEPERSDNANAFFGEDDDTTQLNRADTTNTNNPSQAPPYLFNDNDENDAHNSDNDNNEASNKNSDDATEQEEEKEEEKEEEEGDEDEEEEEDEWIDNDSTHEEENEETTSSSEKDAAEHDSDEDAVIPFHAAFPLRTHHQQQKQDLEHEEVKTNQVQHSRHFDPLNENAVTAPFRRTEKSTQQAVHRLQTSVQHNNFIESDNDGMEERSGKENWFDLHFSHNTESDNNNNNNIKKNNITLFNKNKNHSKEEEQESHRDQEFSNNNINSEGRQEYNITSATNSDILSTLFDNYQSDHITKTRPHRLPPPPLPEAEEQIDEEVNASSVEKSELNFAANQYDNMWWEQQEQLEESELHQENDADRNETNYVDKGLVMSSHNSSDNLQRMAPKYQDSESSKESTSASSSSSISYNNNYKWQSTELQHEKTNEHEHHHHHNYNIIENSNNGENGRWKEKTKLNLAAAEHHTPTVSTVIISPSIPDDLL